MSKLALFLAGLLLGLFCGRFNTLRHAIPAPVSYSLPDNDEDFYPCEYMTKASPLP